MTGMSGPEPFDRVWTSQRAHLVDLAFRMLGDIGEAEDAVQEAFIKLSAADREAIEDERGWLTVVVSRLCLDRIRSARMRRVRPRAFNEPESAHLLPPARDPDPADRVTLDDNVRLALIVLMEQLNPAERVAFVLHDVFQLPFEEVAEVVGRPAATCRQLAHRARQRIESDTARSRFQLDDAEHRLVAERFIAACSSGDFDSLIQVLAPDVSGDVDFGPGGRRIDEHGAEPVAQNLLRFWGPGNVLVSLPVEGELALLAFRDRQLAGLLTLTVAPGGAQVAKVHVTVDPVKLAFVRNLLPTGP